MQANSKLLVNFRVCVYLCIADVVEWSTVLNIRENNRGWAYNVSAPEGLTVHAHVVHPCSYRILSVISHHGRAFDAIDITLRNPFSQVKLPIVYICLCFILIPIIVL